eukprot:COSAG04_NODE_31089_length_258_cov_1.962264_1_plen_67_part_01
MSLTTAKFYSIARPDGRGACRVFFDRREGIPPGERWKAVTTSSLLSNGTDLGTALYGSADGLHFSLL